MVNAGAAHIGLLQLYGHDALESEGGARPVVVVPTKDVRRVLAVILNSGNEVEVELCAIQVYRPILPL